MRYTLAQLRIDLARYRPEHLFVRHDRGATEITLGLLYDFLRERGGFRASTSQGSTSPYLLDVPHQGIVFLSPNPQGGRFPLPRRRTCKSPLMAELKERGGTGRNTPD